MSILARTTRVVGGLAVICLLLAESVAPGAVDLEWRAEGGPAYELGEQVRIGLYAVADAGGANEAFSSVDVILLWDWRYLILEGMHDDGPYEWMYAGLPNDSGLDGLNNTLADGNAYWQAWAMFGDNPVATPQGLRLTTFLFRVVGEGGLTRITIPAQHGLYSVSAVYDDQFGGWNIVGDLGSAEVLTPAREILVGDVNCDGDRDGRDIAALTLLILDPAAFNAAYQGCDPLSADANVDGVVNGADAIPIAGMLMSGCEAGDLNCDGRMDLADVAHFVQALTDAAAYSEAHDGDPAPPCALVLADLNGDRRVDGDDVRAFVEATLAPR